MDNWEGDSRFLKYGPTSTVIMSDESSLLEMAGNLLRALEVRHVASVSVLQLTWVSMSGT